LNLELLAKISICYTLLYENIDQILPNKLYGPECITQYVLHVYTMDTCSM